MAKSLSVEGNNYTSQLNVTISSNIAGKTVICDNDNPSNNIIQLSTVIPITGNFHLKISSLDVAMI